MSWMNIGKPSIVERIVAGICYFTCGLAGLLFILLSGRHNQSTFFRHHFLQSILLGIFAFLFSFCSGIFFQLINGLLSMLVPLLGSLIPQISFWIQQVYAVVVNAFYLLLVYAMVWAFMGKYAEIPFFSDIVRRQI